MTDEERPNLSDADYRALVHECVESIFLYDAETRRILDANASFLRLLGYTAEEVRRLTAYDVVGHPPPEVDAFVAQVATAGSRVIGRRMWRRKDDVMVDVDVSLGRIGDGTRDLVFAIGRTGAEALQPAALPGGRPLRQRRAGRGREPGTALLSRRESQVLKLLAHGFSNRQIAQRLKLSVKTVETFRARIYRKLGLRGRPALVRHAIRAGIFGTEDAPPEE